MTKHDSGTAQASSLSAEIDEALAWCSIRSRRRTKRRAEFWTTRDPSTIGHLYDRDAIAFAQEVLELVDELRAARARADHAETALREAQTYCSRPAGACMPKEPLS